MQCRECDALGKVLLSIRTYTSPDHDQLESIDDRCFCLYHFGHRDREIMADDFQMVDRVEFATGRFDRWQPERPILYTDGDPETELELLRDYLTTFEREHPELHGRLVGVEAALDILQRDRRASDIIDHWPEPWKQRH